MSASLRSVRDEDGEVVAVEQLGGGMVEISARLPHLAATAAPGQFAQLRCWPTRSLILRRPFSVAWTNGDVAAFVLAPVGAGTRLLAALRPGDRLAALGPLGRGFTMPSDDRRVICLSGGLGCAPFPLLVRALRAAGVPRVTVLSGAATAARLYPAERFGRGDAAVDVVECTVDGSRGRAGVVTELLAGVTPGAAAIYACGPNPMLASLARTLEGMHGAAPARVEVSMEAPMGCGYGTCLGCALPAAASDGGPGWILCCQDGPVMPMHRIDWEALMALPPAHVA